MSNRKLTRRGAVKVGLVTEELAGGRASGGIGSAFHELATALASAGFDVDIIYMPIVADATELDVLATYYSAHRIRIVTVPVGDYAWETGACEARSYALLHHLREQPACYDILHFHEYKGLGFFPIRARRQALALPDTTIVVQCHGPTRWALEANSHPFSHEDQLKIDLMERACVADADVVVSPSRYLLDWFADQGWQTPPAGRTHVIQNICTDLQQAARRVGRPCGERVCIDEIVFFGRHEERKGIVPFCDALDRMAPELRAADIRVTFLGRFGTVNGQPSALYLADRARLWDFPIQLLPDMDRAASTRHLTVNPRSLVVIASPVENSPYTVLETAVLGKALLTSDAGGARELLSDATVQAACCPIAGGPLAARMLALLDQGAVPATLAVPPEATQEAWIRLHRDIAERAAPPPAPRPAAPQPTVTVVVTHYERPRKLYDAVLSIAQQTYRHIDLVVIDDGSRSPETLDCLDRLQPLLHKLGATFLTQENRYLGAARNHAVRASTADYLLFLDDDDIAFPTLVQTLVTAAEATRVDVMQCLNLFMDVDARSTALPFPERFRQKVSYLPLGGPLALAPLQNVFGSATSLIRRSAFVAIGGYTEQFGVGHEDYELYVRLLQSGYRLDVCPLPLYLYETGRPSMITRTSRQRNFNRIAQAADLAGVPRAMADLVSLCAGRRALEHADNYRAFLLRTNPDSLLNRLDGVDGNHPDHTRLVSDHAERSGAATMAAALQALTRRRTERPADEPVLAPRARQPASVPAACRPESDPTIIGVLVDLSFARFDEAIAGFCFSLGRDGRLEAAQADILVRLAAATELPPATLAPLARALGACTIEPALYSRLVAPLLALALRAADAALALALIDRAYKNGHARYLDLNDDVRRAVDAGDYASGFDHFTRHGQAEGRPGYEDLLTAHTVAEQEMAARIPVEDIWRVLPVLNAVDLADPAVQARVDA